MAKERLNLRFHDGHHPWAKRRAKALGHTITSYINWLIAEDKRKTP